MALHTPLYKYAVVGEVVETEEEALESVCKTFLTYRMSPYVAIIAKNLPPKASRVARVLKDVLNGPFRADLLKRGFDMKLLSEEVQQEIFSQFKAYGCRLALWDSFLQPLRLKLKLPAGRFG